MRSQQRQQEENARERIDTCEKLSSGNKNQKKRQGEINSHRRREIQEKESYKKGQN